MLFIIYLIFDNFYIEKLFYNIWIKKTIHGNFGRFKILKNMMKIVLIINKGVYTM